MKIVDTYENEKTEEL